MMAAVVISLVLLTLSLSLAVIAFQRGVTRSALRVCKAVYRLNEPNRTPSDLLDLIFEELKKEEHWRNATRTVLLPGSHDRLMDELDELRPEVPA